MLGGKRVACFSPEDEFFAKGCHGIDGHIEIADLRTGKPNDFMAKLFETARKNMQAENDAVASQVEAYNAAMKTIKEMVEGVTDIDTANVCLNAIGAMDHALTSKKEGGALLNNKCKKLGLKYDVQSKAYISAGDAQ